MQNGNKIPSSGDADEASETIAGDIIFVLQLVEHSKFKRKAEDLFIEHALSLTQALCGFQFLLTHLDGRQLLIKSNPWKVTFVAKVESEKIIPVLMFFRLSLKQIYVVFYK